MTSAMILMEIVGPRDLFDCTLRTLQDAGVLDIEEMPLSESGSRVMLHRAHLSEVQLREKQAYEEILALLEEIVREVPASTRWDLEHAEGFVEQYERWDPCSAEDVSNRARVMNAKVRSLMRRRRNIQDDLAVLTSYEEIVTSLRPLVESGSVPADYDVIGVLIDRKETAVEERFRHAVRDMTGDQCRILVAPVAHNRIAAAIGCPPGFKDRIRQLATEPGLSEIRGPRYLKDTPFTELLETIGHDLAHLRDAELRIDGQVKELLEIDGQEVLALGALCRDRLGRFDVQTKSAYTRYAFALKGWVPRKGRDGLETVISSACGDAVVSREIAHHGAGTPPVLLDNPLRIRPFERLLGLLPLPKYGTIDPTWLVAVFFPPFFGLMLGDVGYGLILAAIAFWLHRTGTRRRIQKDLAVVLAWCAFYIILFGFVFGEVFGTLGHELGLKPLWRERFSLQDVDKAGAILGYLAIAVAIGVVHVFSGLILGIINARRTGQRNLILDHVARIMGLVVVFFAVGLVTKLLPAAFISGGVVALVVFLVLMVTLSRHEMLHAVMLPLEILTTVGNILSYARIMAVGLVSAILALLANMFGGMIGNIALAIVVLLLTHALNLVLGVVDPTIQGLRLHYVEFFSKFYMTGGRPYRPIRKMGGMVS